MQKKISEAINKYNSFVLVTHFNPDGDGVGSLVAMSAFLKGLGKKVHAYYTGHLISTYNFLNADGDVEQYEGAGDPDLKIAEAEIIILLDANEWSRTEKMERPLRDSPALKLVIDHHPIEESDFDVTWVDVAAASVGELVFKLIKSMDGRITEKIGVALYVTILTDTGSFRFSNTTSNTHRIAAELIDAGVKTSRLYQAVYERNPVEKVRLLGHCLVNIQMGCNDLVAWISVSQETLKKYNAELWMLDGVVEIVRTITEVEATVLIAERADGKIKASVRSRDKLDVNAVARTLGGGGHPKAAGCKLDMGLKEAEGLIMRKLEEAIAKM
jgi:phosphoesterase RecJ-like protein